jgi:hypothetical protein
MKTIRLISVIIFILAVLIIVGSCATTTQFVYEHPEIPPHSSQGTIVGLFSIDDQREDLKEIDNIYGEFPEESLNQIIEEELKSTGLFEQVLIIPEEMSDDNEYLNQTGVDIIVQTGLLEMKWEVPDYEDKLTKISAASFLGGLLGGMIYGSTTTEVWGDTKINFDLKDIESGEIVLEKDYEAHYVEEMALLECDTKKTKAYIVGKSLKMAIEEHKKDLFEIFK